MSVEIYIDDLKPDIQRQVLEELGPVSYTHLTLPTN